MRWHEKRQRFEQVALLTCEGWRPKSVMKQLVLILAAGLIGAPVARADYAVLRSGVRLHITGCERAGNVVRLTIDGGKVEIAAADILSIEPEELFKTPPATPPAAAGPYVKFIRDAAQKHGVDEALITSVIAAESNFNPRAVSRRQALGLMQLLPQTAARYSVTDIFDPAQNIDAGTQYLKELLEQYHGNLALALAAYNAGPERVGQFRGVPPYRETRAYVTRVTKSLANLKSPPRQTPKIETSQRSSGARDQRNLPHPARPHTTDAQKSAVAREAPRAANPTGR
jgi:soluble lytic murein transglycosylase-like protein